MPSSLVAALPDQAALSLSPAQQRAHDKVIALIGAAPVIMLAGSASYGRSLILRHIAAEQGGRYVCAADLLDDIADTAAADTDAALARRLDALLSDTRLLVIDDPDVIAFGTRVTRSGYLATIVYPHLHARAAAESRTILLSGPIWGPGLSAAQVYPDFAAVGIQPFVAEDYAAITRHYLGARASQIDFRQVFRFASMLNAQQLTRVAQALQQRPDGCDAQAYLATLQALGILANNVRTDRVEAIEFATMPGHEAIVKRLMTHIVVPMENRELAARLDLRPKRGVLLYGPPGTGKTSVGRALAHRLQGKFFMIDGSFISEPPGEFFHKINAVIQEAKRHSPSLLFIDDADVLFGVHHIAGLTRMLLSLLDGIESETASNVCIMMTAMDVRHVPEALLRSGRVELWLETQLPDGETRAAILRRWIASELPGSASLDYAAIALRTARFTPADLRRVANEAKALYAIDVVRQKPAQSATAYVLAAVEALVALRETMAVNLRDDRLRLRDHTAANSAGYAAGLGGLAGVGSGGEPGW